MIKAKLGTFLLNGLIPLRCLVCEGYILQHGMVCAECFKMLPFITDPRCRLCGQPFLSSQQAGPDSICIECLEISPSYVIARAPFCYTGPIPSLIARFKYGGDLGLAKSLGTYMFKEMQDILKSSDLLLPVPLHRTRLKKRGYNQALLLAKVLSRLSQVPYCLQGLERSQNTQSLARKNRAERYIFLREIIHVCKEYEDFLRLKKHIVIIDDILTTGATVEACIWALQKVTQAKISIATFARTVDYRLR